MSDTNRYVVKIEAYVYGRDDYHARMNAHKMLDKINAKHLNADAEIKELGSQPFGTMQYRELEDFSRPSKLDADDDAPLPF
jgi:hypothetical protein|tara:strand:+ start:94 stop:336 length:243 start_codon:yes stop_codon:yes gene_type:complete